MKSNQPSQLPPINQHQDDEVELPNFLSQSEPPPPAQPPQQRFVAKNKTAQQPQKVKKVVKRRVPPQQTTDPSQVPPQFNTQIEQPPHDAGYEKEVEQPPQFPQFNEPQFSPEPTDQMELPNFGAMQQTPTQPPVQQTPAQPPVQQTPAQPPVQQTPAQPPVITDTSGNNPTQNIPQNPSQSSSKSRTTSSSTPPRKAITKKRAPAAQEKIPLKQDEPRKSGVPFTVFLFLVIYSCLTTVLCVHLYIESWAGNPDQLESLPDIVPEIKDGQAVYHLIPEDQTLPAGHTLQLGQSRRYGNIQVTPLKVTQGELAFSHYSGDENKTRPPVKSSLKLWVELKNVSEDQTFSPLDRKLMLLRVADKKDSSITRSNQFVTFQKDQAWPGHRKLLYDLPIEGEWNFADISDDMTLKPGESVSIYVPSEELEEDYLSSKSTSDSMFGDYISARGIIQKHDMALPRLLISNLHHRKSVQTRKMTRPQS